MRYIALGLVFILLLFFLFLYRDVFIWKEMSVSGNDGIINYRVNRITNEKQTFIVEELEWMSEVEHAEYMVLKIQSQIDKMKQELKEDKKQFESDGELSRTDERLLMISEVRIDELFEEKYMYLEIVEEYMQSK